MDLWTDHMSLDTEMKGLKSIENRLSNEAVNSHKVKRAKEAMSPNPWEVTVPFRSSAGRDVELLLKGV